MTFLRLLFSCVYTSLVMFVPQQPSYYNFIISTAAYTLTLGATLSILHFLYTRPIAQKTLLNRILALLLMFLGFGSTRCYVLNLNTCWFHPQLTSFVDAHPSFSTVVLPLNSYSVLAGAILVAWCTGRLTLIANPVLYHNCRANSGFRIAGIIGTAICILDSTYSWSTCGNYGDADNIRLLKIVKEELGIYSNHEVGFNQTQQMGYQTLDMVNNHTLDMVNNQTLDMVNNQILDMVNNQTLDMGNNQTLDLGNNKTLDMGNNQALDMGNNQTLDLVNNETLDMGNNQTLDMGNNQILSIGFNHTVNNGYKKTGYHGSNQTVYTGNYQTVYTDNNQTGYTGRNQTGYRGSNQSGYTGNYQTGYTSNSPTVYTGNNQTGYTGSNQTGYTGNYQTVYTGNNRTGYTGNNQTIYTSNNQAGYTGNNQTGYTGKNKTNYSGNYQTGFSGNYQNGYTGNNQTDYTGNYQAGYTGNYQDGYTGNNQTGYNGNNQTANNQTDNNGNNQTDTNGNNQTDNNGNNQNGTTSSNQHSFAPDNYTNRANYYTQTNSVYTQENTNECTFFPTLQVLVACAIVLEITRLCVSFAKDIQTQKKKRKVFPKRQEKKADTVSSTKSSTKKGLPRRSDSVPEIAKYAQRNIKRQNSCFVLHLIPVVDKKPDLIVKKEKQRRQVNQDATGSFVKKTFNILCMRSATVIIVFAIVGAIGISFNTLGYDTSRRKYSSFGASFNIAMGRMMYYCLAVSMFIWDKDVFKHVREKLVCNG